MSGILSRAARLAGPLWFALQDYSMFRNCSVLDTDLGLFLQCLQTGMGAEQKMQPTAHGFMDLYSINTNTHKDIYVVFISRQIPEGP